MTSFAAEPGTWLINYDPDEQPVPILGWDVSGVVAFPILPFPGDPVSGQAYRLPGTGAVVDPAWAKTFESEDAWRAALGRHEPYEMGTSLLFTAEPKKSKPAAAPKAAPEKANAPAASDETSAEVAGQLSWGKKQLKNRSFWHFSGSPEVVFIIEGGKTLPEGDDVDKITRDKFYELRKELTEATIDPDNLPEQEEDEMGGLV